MAEPTVLIGKTLVAVEKPEYMTRLIFSDGTVIRCEISEVLTKDEYVAKIEAEKAEAKAIYDALVVKAEAVKAVVPKVL